MRGIISWLSKLIIFVILEVMDMIMLFEIMPVKLLLQCFVNCHCIDCIAYRGPVYFFSS